MIAISFFFGFVLTKVLVTNPQSAKSNKVMQGKLIAGAKEKLESQLSAAGSKRELALKNLVMAWHEDSLVNAHDSIITLLQNEDRLSAKYALVEAHLNTGDTVSAISVYQSINTDFDLNTKESTNWQDYAYWLEYRKEQIARGKAVTKPDSLQLVWLYQLHSNTENQLKAALRNLLRFSDTLTYKEPYLSIDTTLKQSRVIYRPVGNNSNNNNELLVYPNPANTYLIVDFSGLEEATPQSIITFYTIDGRKVSSSFVNLNTGFKVVDTRFWTPGIYVVSLKQKGRKAYSNTIIVNH